MLYQGWLSWHIFIFEKKGSVNFPMFWNDVVNKLKHDDVIKWKHFPRYWSFVRGIHRSPVNSLHKGQWRGAVMLYFICVWKNGWENNREAGDLRRYRTHYAGIVKKELNLYLPHMYYIQGRISLSSSPPATNMTTSSNRNIFRVTDLLWGIRRSICVFHLHRNKRWSKQSSRRWFETPSRPL